MSPGQGDGSVEGATWTILWKDQVPSTMQWAREQARAEAANRSVFAAREQTAGLGRAGRTWTSPPGGLYASLLLREPAREWAPLMPLVGALAVQQMLASCAPGLRVLVKWPNDVLAVSDGQRGKVAGVLTEATAAAERIAWVIIGTGVNLDVPKEQMPGDLDPPAVSLSSLGYEAPSVEEALDRLLSAFSDIERRHEGSPHGVVRDVEEVLAMKGERVRIERRGVLGDVVGTLLGLDDTARAVVETKEGVVEVPAWDAVRVRGA